MHRPAGFHEFVQQFHFVGVAQAVTRPLGLHRLLAVGLRADVGAALQDQAIQVLRVVGKADAAAVHDAIAAHRRNHEHHDFPRHHPMGDRLLQIMQRLGLQAGGTGQWVVNPCRKADT